MMLYHALSFSLKTKFEITHVINDSIEFLFDKNDYADFILIDKNKIE